MSRSLRAPHSGIGTRAFMNRPTNSRIDASRIPESTVTRSAFQNQHFSRILEFMNRHSGIHESALTRSLFRNRHLCIHESTNELMNPPLRALHSGIDTCAFMHHHQRIMNRPLRVLHSGIHAGNTRVALTPPGGLRSNFRTKILC